MRSFFVFIKQLFKFFKLTLFLFPIFYNFIWSLFFNSLFVKNFSKVNFFLKKYFFSNHYLVKRILPAFFFLFLIATVSAQVTVGPNFPDVGANVTGIGTVAWSNPNRIYVSDDSRSSTTLDNSEVSNYLKGTDYDFAIPTNATILGIQVTIGRRASQDYRIFDNQVKLVKNNTITGDNKAESTIPWPTTEADYSYGGASDLWGTTWTPADINNINFGAVVAVTCSRSSNVQAAVDYITISVTYVPPVG
jgi:hypothetical protein